MMKKEEIRPYWQERAEGLLKGRKIIAVTWQTPEEADKHGWDQQAVKIYLDDGTHFCPQRDDEGNDAGALIHVNPNETETSEYFPGEVFTKTDVLPVFRGE